MALFRGLFRFWGRLRVEVLRDWARSEVSQAVFQLAEGRRASDGVVRSLVRGLIHQSQGRHVVEVDMDVKKYFDHVVRSTLIDVGAR